MTTYRALKREFQQDKRAFTSKYSDDSALLAAIRVLAGGRNDNGWPLGMLSVLAPDLAMALDQWTAGGYEEIRNAQEEGRVKAGSPADQLIKNFSKLPLWGGRATHVSKSPELFDRIRNEGKITLSSFMGCCAPPHTFAYVSKPSATLRFTKLSSARLVGALTHENLEREVLLPPGASFDLVDWDMGNRNLTLHEN